MPQPERLVTPTTLEQDAPDAALRPQRLADFTGQQAVRQNLEIFIQAAKGRGQSLDHVL
ncbi:MAG: Holliday junction branch migration DNA helicase RuvB, partial [Proteobacteria bacterium]|nr:Holliday junction branch migration DNA helicase RuvB [Pseudomonadota bacterium]